MNSVVLDQPIEAGANDTSRPLLRVSPRIRDEPRLMSIVTLVICLVVGFLGFALPYLRPQPPVKSLPPITAELLNVEFTSEPLPPVNPAPPLPSVIQPPPLAKPTAIPPPPPLASVAAPSPQIAFAIPIEAPGEVVPAKEASYRTVEAPPVVESTPAAAPQPLNFGQGAGKQPAPDYARQALREGQEGIVTVRMTVGANGRVMAAEASSPSPWPLLNDAAVRVVKSRWRFMPGPVRAYEVEIRFQLSK
jgi:periplasmic protein TonB